MKKQITNIEARNQLILQLTKDNANEDCQKIIELLPNENLSLNEMINACAKVGSQSHNAALLANSIVIAVKLALQCCKCGQQGHFRTNFPCKTGTPQVRGNANIYCSQGGKHSHTARQCKCKVYTNRQSFKD